MALISVWLLSGMKHLPLTGRGLPWVPTPSGTHTAPEAAVPICRNRRLTWEDPTP
jgi:hypothetical protein